MDKFKVGDIVKLTKTSQNDARNLDTWINYIDNTATITKVEEGSIEDIIYLIRWKDEDKDTRFHKAHLELYERLDIDSILISLTQLEEKYK